MTNTYLLIIIKEDGKLGWMQTDNPEVPNNCISAGEMAFVIQPRDLKTISNIVVDDPPDTTFDDVMGILRLLDIMTNESITDKIIDYFKKKAEVDR